MVGESFEHGNLLDFLGVEDLVFVKILILILFNLAVLHKGLQRYDVDKKIN